MNNNLGFVFILLLAFGTLSAACGGDGHEHHHNHGPNHPSHNHDDHGNTDRNQAQTLAHEPNEAAHNHAHDGHDHAHEGHDHAHDGHDHTHEGHDHTHAGHDHAHGAGHDHAGHDHGSCGHAHGHADIHSEGSSSTLASSDYIIAFSAGAFVPFVSFLGNLACRYFKDGVTKFLPVLVSFGAGTMLASATVSFIPEAVAHTNLTEDPHSAAFFKLGLPILVGMLVSILMEFVIHSLGGHHHDHDDLGFSDVEAAKHKNHSEMQAMAWNMLIADAIHNTIDGMLIGTTFMTGIWQGFMITMLIIFHELPQEIAELCILLHAGWPMRKAIIRNCVSTLTILIGVGIGLALANKFAFIQTYCIAFIAGEFLYVSLGQLMPSLSRTVMSRRQTILSHLTFAAGVIFICFLTYQFPHSHGDHAAHSGCSH